MKNSSSSRMTNFSNDVSPLGNISWQLGDLLLSNNSSNISSNSTRNSSENIHRKILEQNHQFQNEPSGLAQTWQPSQLFPSSSQSSNYSRDLYSSKNSSGSRGNSNENLHRQLLKRNHHLQNEPQSFGTNLGKNWQQHSIQIVSSSDSDNSPNSSRDLNIEQAFQPIILHSSPSNSMADIPALDFSSSSNESLD